MNSKKIKTGTMYRSAMFIRADVDEENRTVPIAFSSEEPADRWFGKEILDHGKGSIRLGRLKDSGPLLMDHDPRDHVGVVETVKIDTDRIGRAQVRFGKSARAEEVFQDVLDGIRTSISVGYHIHKLVLEESSDNDSDVYRATDWEPLEVSVVSVPLDYKNAGIGRGHDDGEHLTIMETRDMKKTPEQIAAEEAAQRAATSAPAAPAAPAPAAVIDPAAERASIRSDELARINDMNALGEQFDCREVAQQFITEGKTVDALRVAILDKVGKPTPAAQRTVDDNPDIGLTDREAQQFSFLRAINALANPNDRRAQELAAFEIECSIAVAQKRGVSAQGIYVPEAETNVLGYDWKSARGKQIQMGMVPSDVLRRDLSAGTATDGAELVATNLLAGSFIDVLRNALVVAQMGATFLRDLNGDVAIPRKTSGSAGGWIATEGGDAAQSDPQFDQVTLTPKTVGSYTEYTRQLRLQSSLDVEALVRADLALGLATTIDLGSLYGSGSSGQPTGVINTTGVGKPTKFAAANPTYAEAIALETEVSTDNALIGALGYILRGDMRGAMKTTVKDAGSGQFVWEPGNTVNGYNTGVTSQVTAGDLFFGNWADLLIGMWGGLDLLIDPYTGSLSGTTRIVAHQSVDVAVRHPESFSWNNDT